MPPTGSRSAAGGAQVPGRRGRAPGGRRDPRPAAPSPSRRAGSVRRSADAPARRALAGRVLDALLEHEALDTTVRGRLERLLPAGCGSAARPASSFQRSTSPTPGAGATSRARAARPRTARSARRATRPSSSRRSRSAHRRPGQLRTRSSAPPGRRRPPPETGAAQLPSSSPATVFRWFFASSSMWRWYRACDQPPWSCWPAAPPRGRRSSRASRRAAGRGPARDRRAQRRRPRRGRRAGRAARGRGRARP